MITLQEVEDRVRSLTEHYPEQKGYRAEIKEIISTAQDVIWYEADWNFKYKEQEMRVYPDITSATSNSQTLAVTHMQRDVTFSAAVAELGYGYYHHDWVGQVLEIGGRDYPILQILSATSVILEEPYQGADLTTDTSWKFKHRYYFLPNDCERLIGWTSMDKPFPGNSAISSDLGTNISSHMAPIRNQDQTADNASVIFKAEDLRLPAAGQISVVWGNTGITTAFPINKWHEFAWSFYAAGRHGPLSKSTISKASAGTYNTLSLYCLDTKGSQVLTPSITYADTPYRVKWEGLYKMLWFNANVYSDASNENAVRRGKPCWMPIYSESSAGQLEHQPYLIPPESYAKTFLESTILNSDQGVVLSAGGPKRTPPSRYRPHNIQRVQPWPRINRTDATYTADTSPTSPAQAFTADIISYMAYPTEMILDTDPMCLPPAFLNLLIYKAAHAVFTKLNNPGQAAHYQAMYMAELERLMRAYVPSKVTNILNGRWSYSTDSDWPFGYVGRGITITG